eukprot:1755749-Prorocentrum_lima.AAC.1
MIARFAAALASCVNGFTLAVLVPRRDGWRGRRRVLETKLGATSSLSFGASLPVAFPSSSLPPGV